MSNKPNCNATKPKVDYEIVIQGMSNKQVNVKMPEDLDIAMDLMIFTLSQLRQAKKQKAKQGKLIEVPDMAGAAADYVRTH